MLSPADIQKQQDEQIEEVSAILGQPLESAAILLRHMRWNKERLVEKYMEDAEQILDGAGLEIESSSDQQMRKVPGFSCEICCEDDEDLETYALKCGHRFCTDCFRHYLGSKIRDEGEAARIQCPSSGCKRIVDSRSLEILVAGDTKDR